MKKLLIVSSAFIVLIVIVTFAFIKPYNINADKQLIILTEKSRIGKTAVKSKLKMPHKLKSSINGTVNDTIIFNGEKLSPPRINIVNKTDWYADSIIYNFDPYKATKVKLKLVYTFYQ